MEEWKDIQLLTDRQDRVRELISEFSPISLAEMESASLMDRQDTKFTFNIKKLPAILEVLRDDYFVFDNKGVRFNHYRNIYYDTPDFLLYSLHHRGRLNRFKIRMRRYEESDLNFLEVKFKSNKERTEKIRRKTGKFQHQFSKENAEFIGLHSPFNAGDLMAVVEIEYDRITLVKKDLSERCTFDLNLSFRHEGKYVSHKEMVIVELKQGRFNVHSPVMRKTKELGIYPYSMSKYCFGINCLYPELKSNNFKAKIRHLKKLVYGNS